MMPVIIAICALLILDITWISLSKNMYAGMVQAVQNSPMDVSFIFAIIAYILMILGFVYLVIPLLDSKNILFSSIRNGGLFGFVVYGIYNATNLAIFKKYKWWIGMIDTLWGTIVYTLVSYIYLKLQK